METLGVFFDNHDVKRAFNLLTKDDMETSKPTVLNILTYIYLSYGIPMIYYGTEAAFSGGNDPENREVFDPLNRHSA